jgi:sugar lactone lactonase YvrE
MEAFKIKNGLQAGRYLGSNGTETAGTVGYNLAGASYDSVSFSVASQDAGPRAIAFKSDGTKLYHAGTTNDTIYQYSLSTAWDVSTASYDSVSFSVASQGQPTGLVFKSDGTKFYLSENNTSSVYQYSLSTAWDMSTASYDSVSFSVASQGLYPHDVVFKSDGSSMYVYTSSDETMYQYTLSTAWDLSTSAYASRNYAFANAEDASPEGMDISEDGTKFYMVGRTTDSVYQYTLSTAWDISTASYDNVLLNISSQDTDPYNTVFGNSGQKLYAAGNTTDTIYQYSTVSYTQTLDLSTGTTFSFTPSGATTVSFTNPPATGTAIGFSVEINGDGSAITWPSSVKWHKATAPTATATKELYTFVTTDGGTTYYGKKAAEGVA